MTRKQKRITKKVVIYIVLVIMTIASLFPIFFCLSASLRTQEDLFRNMFPFYDKVFDSYCGYRGKLQHTFLQSMSFGVRF